MKTGAITSAGFYIVPYYVRGRAITIFLELERCYFSPQVCELCMATWQKCIPCCYNTGVNQKVLPVLSTETLLHIWLSTEYYGFRPSSTAVDTGDTRGLMMSK